MAKKKNKKKNGIKITIVSVVLALCVSGGILSQGAADSIGELFGIETVTEIGTEEDIKTNDKKENVENITASGTKENMEGDTERETKKNTENDKADSTITDTEVSTDSETKANIEAVTDTTNNFVVDLSSIPEFTDKPYIEINGNIPGFTEADYTI